MTPPIETELTRRQMLVAGGTFAGYAMSVDTVLAQAIAPELFVREGGVGQIPNVQDVLKIVLAQKREQTLGDLKAAVDWAKTRPGAPAGKVGVTGWCWGGSTVYQVAATTSDMKAAVAWYGPPARPYQGANGPVTGFDLAKDIKIP